MLIHVRSCYIMLNHVKSPFSWFPCLTLQAPHRSARRFMERKHCWSRLTDATSKPDPDRWPFGGWIPKWNLRIPESTIVSALYQSLYSHYILWMEEILHQLIDGLSDPIISYVYIYIIIYHILYHIYIYYYIIYIYIHIIISYTIIHLISPLYPIYISYIISYTIEYHIYTHHHDITITISYIYIYHHYITICPIIYHIYSTCVSRGLQGRSDWCHAGEGGDPLPSSRFCRLLVEPPKMDQRGMVPPILYGYTVDILFM